MLRIYRSLKKRATPCPLMVSYTLAADIQHPPEQAGFKHLDF